MPEAGIFIVLRADSLELSFTRRGVSIVTQRRQSTLACIFKVAALTEWPALMELAPNVFPKDVIARAKEFL